MLSRLIRRICASLPSCAPRCVTGWPEGIGRIASDTEPRSSVLIEELQEVRRRVAVVRQAAAGGLHAGRHQRQHAVAPVEAGHVRVEPAVAGRDVDAIGARIERRAAATPDAAAAEIARQRTVAVVAGAIEVRRVVAAQRVEHVLHAVGEIDRRQVALVVAGIAAVAVGDDVEIRDAARRSDREAAGALLDIGLQRDQLGPAAAGDFVAVADVVFVHEAVETVRVDETAPGIDRRCGRRRLVARFLMRPDDRSVGDVDRHQHAVLLRAGTTDRACRRWSRRRTDKPERCRRSRAASPDSAVAADRRCPASASFPRCCCRCASRRSRTASSRWRMRRTEKNSRKHIWPSARRASFAPCHSPSESAPTAGWGSHLTPPSWPFDDRRQRLARRNGESVMPASVCEAMQI